MLDLLVTRLVVSLPAIVIQLRASVNPGLLSLGLLNIMSFNVNLADLIKQWTVLDPIGGYLEVEGVRRIDEIRTQVPREPGTGTRNQEHLGQGRVQFPSKASLQLTASLLTLY